MMVSFLLLKMFIFGEPQNRGYFRESSYEGGAYRTPLVLSSSSDGFIPYLENVPFLVNRKWRGISERALISFGNTPAAGDLTGSRKMNLTAYVSLSENRVFIVGRSTHRQFFYSPPGLVCK